METHIAVLPFYQFLEPYLVTAFGLLVSALLTWLVTQFQTRTGIHVSADARAAVQQAATNAAGRILASQEGSIANMSVDMHSPLVAAEVPLVTAAVGDAINHLGMTPDRVAALVAGKIGLLQAAAAPAASAAPTPSASTGVTP